MRLERLFPVLLLLISATSVAAQTRSVTAESQNNGYRRYNVGDVQRAWIERRLSDAECVANRTWGFDDRGIWVDKGCRAEISYTLSDGNVGGRDDLQEQKIRCESKSGRREVCAADTSRGVTLSKQLSLIDCVRGETWGTDRNGIWVDDGCRAEFIVGGARGVKRPVAESLLRCESTDGRRKFCEADTRGGVTLSRQLSKTDCVEDESWGWDRRGVWVTDGCRAEFRLGRGGSYGWGYGDENDRGRQTITCESKNGERERCLADTSRGVRLLRQKSKTDCVEGQTWGYDRKGIWVDDGCRADFQLGR